MSRRLSLLGDPVSDLLLGLVSGGTQYLDAWAEYAATPPVAAPPAAPDPRLSPEDQDHERRIDWAWGQMCVEPDRARRIAWHDQMVELIKQRSPEAVALLEQARGLVRAG